MTTTQDFIDWAMVQSPGEPEVKLVLVFLAYKSGPEGGGRIPLSHIAGAASLDQLSALGALRKLQEAGLIVFTMSDDKVVAYGLSVGGAAPS